MSMMCRSMWPFVLMYGSHDMRYIGFSQVDGGQRDPREMGRHKIKKQHTKLDLHVQTQSSTHNSACQSMSSTNTPQNQHTQARIFK